MPGSKMRKSDPDLSEKNSLTSYILKYSDKLRKFKTKEQLVRFLSDAKDEGVSVSDAKLNNVTNKIKKSRDFPIALAYVYNLMLKGHGMGVVAAESTVKMNRSQLKEIVKEIINEIKKKE